MQASIDNPLAFFEDLFIHKGFTDFKYNFSNIEPENTLRHFDYQTEILSYDTLVEDNTEDGSRWVTIKEDFKKVLALKLENEKWNGIRNIDLRISACNSKEDIISLLELFEYRLTFISKALDLNTEAAKYPANKRVVEEIYKYIVDCKNKFKPFIDNISISGNKGLDITTNELKKIGSSVIKPKYGFKLILNDTQINARYEKLDDLLDALVKAGFIDENIGKIVFRSAFNDKRMSKKILWIGTETDLRYFISRLNKLNKINSRISIWEATKNCFIVNGSNKEITSRRFSALKNPNKTKIQILNKIISQL